MLCFLSRFLAGFLVTITTLTPVSAAEKLDNVRPLANVMINLYVGCMQSKWNVTRLDDITASHDIAEMVNRVDEWCLTWANIWFLPLTGVEPLSLGSAHVERFTAARTWAAREFELAITREYNELKSQPAQRGKP